jgi:DNA-directed RNA polymerase specialized sigma24 family protein
VKGFNRWFASTSTIQLKSTEILYKLANRVFGEAAKDTLEQSKILQSIKKEYDIWAKKKGLSAKNYFDIIKKKGSNHLIDEYNPEFYTELKNKTIDKDYSWIRDNVDKEAYAKFLEEYRNKQYERIKNKARFGTEQENLRDVQTEINDIATLYNVTSPDAPGWLIYDFVKKFPKQQWESKEWIELNKPENAPAKRFYDYIRERNEEYDRVGYINSAQSRTFLPFVRKSLMEKIVMGGQVKLGEELLRQITISEGDVGYGKIDPITKEPVYSIPKYFTKDTGDEVSDDLFRNMALLNEMAIRYQYLSEIEGQMRLIARVESNKEAIKTSYFGKTKYKSNGDPETTSDNKDNTELLRHMMEAIVYGHKYVESENFDQLLGSVANFGKRANKVLGANVFPEKYDEFQISLNKSLTTLNNFFQLKTLGLNPLSALSSLFGGSFQSIINAGTYFTKSEFLANEFKIAGRMKGADAKKHLAALEYFLPLTENYNAQISRQLSLGATPEGVQEILMSLMRNADQYVQTVNFFSYLDNTIVVDGKLVNAREYLRKQDKYQGIYNVPQTERDALFKEFEQDVKELVKEKGVMNVATLSDNNSLVIPGVDGKDDSVFELRRKVQALTKDALGNLTDDDIRKINLNIIGKSFMIFKNWIPRLVDVRIGNLKYNSATDAYEWGRSRMVMNILSDGVLKSAKRFIDITQMNDDGIAYVREMFEKKREEYEKETGKPLRMTEQEFIDLVRKNVKDQAVDLVFYLTLTSMFLALKAMAPDDKDDKLAQNRYKFMLRAVDKIRDEISYFYNPTSLVNLTKSGIFPSTGLITNFVKMFENFGKEMYYIGVDDVKAQEKNQVVKYFLKGFPVTYEFDLPLLLFFPDVAKDLGMKAQGEARPIGQ